MDAHFARLEEAAKRDHRVLGKQLDLFSIQELAGAGLDLLASQGRHDPQDHGRLDARGMPAARLSACVHAARGAREPVADQRRTRASTRATCLRPWNWTMRMYRMKPMNCPFHILIYKNSPKSYRDLPVRYAELGNVYRYERSGTMHGSAARARLYAGRRAHLLHALARSRARWQPASTLPRRC